MQGRNALVLVCIGLLAPGLVAAERRDHDAHVHGTAEMDVAALGRQLEIALRSPAMNVVGFEHEPRTDEQRERLHGAIEALRDGVALFSFGEAACRLVEAEVRHGHDAAGHAGGEHGHGEHDGEHARGDDVEDASHSEMHAHYHFACEGTVARLETRLFERFPGTGSIHVQYLTDDAQGAQTLTPEAPVLRLQ